MEVEGHDVDLVFLKELEEKFGMKTEAVGGEKELDEIIEAAGKCKMQDDSAEGVEEEVEYTGLKYKIDINYSQMFPFVLCCGITSKPQPGDIMSSINVHNGIPPEFPRVGVESVGGKGTEGGSPQGADSDLSESETQEQLLPQKRKNRDGTTASQTPWHALSLLMDIAHLLSVEDVGARRDARSSVGDALEVLVEQRQP